MLLPLLPVPVGHGSWGSSVNSLLYSSLSCRAMWAERTRRGEVSERRAVSRNDWESGDVRSANQNILETCLRVTHNTPSPPTTSEDKEEPCPPLWDPLARPFVLPLQSSYLQLGEQLGDQIHTFKAQAIMGMFFPVELSTE